MESVCGRATAVAAVSAFLCLATAPAAVADVRFAEPGGDGPAADCFPSDPCDIEVAVEDATVGDGDEVILLAGDYSLAAELTVGDEISLHGLAGQAVPRILSSSATAVAVDADADLADLAIEHSGGGTGLDLRAGSADRLYVRSSGEIACATPGTVALRNSVCWSIAAAGSGVGSDTTDGVPHVTLLRNVTAVASGAASVGIEIETDGAAIHGVDARNVIAQGALFDLAGSESGGSTTSIALESSNFSSISPIGGASITPAGDGANQVLAPQFVAAPAGDFHQGANSVTIDAGTNDGQLGALDLDSSARILGAAPDIGAYELAPGPVINGDKFPPDTGIRKGPKKKTIKRNVKFEFGGSEPGVTFECQLDDDGWEPCGSPVKLKGLKRTQHVFAVRAVDAAGNADPTPADRRWQIKKRKKPH